jgi:hypothetical protein
LRRGNIHPTTCAKRKGSHALLHCGYHAVLLR